MDAAIVTSGCMVVNQDEAAQQEEKENSKSWVNRTIVMVGLGVPEEIGTKPSRQTVAGVPRGGWRARGRSEGARGSPTGPKG